MTDYKPDDIMRMFGIDSLGAPIDHLTRPICGYGDVIVKTHEDGTRTVEHADDVIAISTWVLSQQPECGIRCAINGDGLFAADSAGEYVYRPVHFAEQGRVVVCERVR